MASEKISAMLAAETVNDGDLVPIVQGGINKKCTVAQIAAGLVGVGISDIIVSAPLLTDSDPDTPTLGISAASYSQSGIVTTGNQIMGGIKSVDGLAAIGNETAADFTAATGPSGAIGNASVWCEGMYTTSPITMVNGVDRGTVAMYNDVGAFQMELLDTDAVVQATLSFEIDSPNNKFDLSTGTVFSVGGSPGVSGTDNGTFVGGICTALPSSSAGADGADGADGVGVSSAYLDVDDLHIVLTDTTDIDVGNVRGSTGADGADGADGTSFVYQGVYNGVIGYFLNEVVSYGGSSYICISPSSAGQDPISSPSNWAILSSVGATGSAGSAGSNGAAACLGSTWVYSSSYPSSYPASGAFSPNNATMSNAILVNINKHDHNGADLYNLLVLLDVGDFIQFSEEFDNSTNYGLFQITSFVGYDSTSGNFQWFVTYLGGNGSWPSGNAHIGFSKKGDTGSTGSTGSTGPAGPVAGLDTQVCFNDAGLPAGNANLVFDKSSGTLTTKAIHLENGAGHVAIEYTAAGSWTLGLPATVGSAGQILKTDGTTHTDWIDPTAGMYTVGNGSNWTGSPPTTIQAALDRIAAALTVLSTSP